MTKQRLFTIYPSRFVNDMTVTLMEMWLLWREITILECPLDKNDILFKEQIRHRATVKSIFKHSKYSCRFDQLKPYFSVLEEIIMSCLEFMVPN